MKSNDIGGSNTFTHNHNCLMGTIIFEVYHITPTSPRNTHATLSKAFRFFLLFMFFAYFSFKHIIHHNKHGFYESHTDVLWLMSFSGEMIIHVFLLGFSSPFHQKEWFKIWKIRDQPNHTIADICQDLWIVFFHLFLGPIFMFLMLDLNNMFLEVLNPS